MNSKLAQWCEGLIEAGILVALIAAPLFFNIHSERVFEPDKLTLVRSIAVLMAAAWLAAFIDRQGWQDLSWLKWRSPNSVWRMPFMLPVFLLVIVYLLSTIFSVVPRVSWAGSYQRLQGTYTTFSYIVIFALAAATIRRREQINRIVTTVIVTSIPISLYALLQHYGLDPLPWGGNVQRRVAGHMGNAIFIAAYLIMAVPLTVGRIVDAFTNILRDEELSYSDVVRSSVYIFTLAIQLVAIYWSQSRGPLLGLLVAMFAFILILLVSLRNAETEQGRFSGADAGRAALMVVLGLGVAFAGLWGLLSVLSGSIGALAGPMTSFAAFIGAIGVTVIAVFVMMAAGKGWRWLWLSWLLLALFLAGWLVVFNLPPEVGDPAAEQPVVGEVVDALDAWRELPTVGRFGSLLEAEEGTGRVRVLIWTGVLDLLEPHEPIQFPDGEEDSFNFLRPLIGYGPESMYVAYNRFYIPELATVEARNASPDRSHNETFDALVITGVLGFLVWQILYVSVFYYGFRWLGVVDSKRDRNVMIALWVLGAIAGAIIMTQALGLVYIGVAIPFGSIGGLVLYLIYYALFSGSSEANGEEKALAVADDPFHVDRLLMIGLLAAVMAHYVEVHFGIAIAATRVHFFVYVALMFLVGHLLPRLQEEGGTVQTGPAPSRVRRSRRRRGGGISLPAGVSGPMFAATFVLAIIVATLGYEFMNYSRPPGLEVQELADVPSAGTIMHQAFFVNPGENFSDSPFIFLMIALTWALGSLAFLSEMAKLRILNVRQALQRITQSERRNAATVFVAMIVVALGLRLLSPPQAAGRTTLALGQGLLLIWSALCLYAALRLGQGHETAQDTAGIVAAIGLVFSLPVLVAGGGLYGTTMLLGSATVLYLLWEGEWNSYLLPGLVVALLSLIIGLGYAYVQAAQIRTAIFLGPGQQVQTELQRLLATTDQFARFLTIFYMFIIGMLLLAAFVLARRSLTRVQSVGSTAGFVSLVVLLAASIYVINVTNLRIIQADVVYKQARPLDTQASRAQEPQFWDAPIAIYEHAIELAPQEDFYYLFLGRAYLEKAGLVQDPAESEALLETARNRLQVAQEVNPLNTDHTANLARLTTRWATTVESAQEREELIAQANDYYQDALSLSPQNSVIRNEYANLLISLDSDCEAGIETYERSLEIDPYYYETYFNLAGVYERCATQVEGEEQEAYYTRAASLLEEGLEQGSRRERNRYLQNEGTLLVQAGQLYQQGTAYQEAIAVLEEARQVENARVPEWNIDLQLANVYQAMGDLEQAEAVATRALAAAPADAQGQIEEFLAQLNEQ